MRRISGIKPGQTESGTPIVIAAARKATIARIAFNEEAHFSCITPMISRLPRLTCHIKNRRRQLGWIILLFAVRRQRKPLLRGLAFLDHTNLFIANKVPIAP
jgi:hypothetical protein